MIRPALALVIAAAVALLLVLALALLAASAVLDPEGGPAQFPRPPQAPPWGFVGNWQDYCYRPLPKPPDYAAERSSRGERCPSGSTRFSTGQQIGLTARAGATIDRLGVFWGAVEPEPPVTRGGRRIHVYNWAAVMRPTGQ